MFKSVATPTEKISEFVRSWYDFGRSGSIPSIRSSNFGSFVGYASDFVHQINPETVCSFKIDAKAETAYIDFENNVIALPIWYFSPDAISTLLNTTEDDESIDFEAISLALCNGSHIHEGLHDLFTKRVSADGLVSIFFASLSPSGLAKYKVFQKTMGMISIANIYEDIMNEAFAPTYFGDKHFLEFLQLKNSLLFPQSSIDEMIDSYESVAPGTAEQLTARINIFCAMKNEKLRGHAAICGVDDVEAIANLAIKLVNTMPTWSEDTSVSLNYLKEVNFESVLESIIGDIPFDASSDEGKGAGGDGGEKSEGSANPMTNSEPATDNEKKAAASLTPTEVEELGKALKSFVEATDDLIAKREAEKAVRKGEYPYKVKFERDIMKVERVNSGKELLLPAPWAFVSILKQLRSKNHTPGVVQKRGTKISKTHLVRIGQDGKIFTSPNVESHKLGQTDVVLLIDASGSMGTIISKVVSTSFDLFNALRKCGINVDAYAHTATARDSKVPVLYHVCSGGVKGHSSNVRERFEKLLTVCYSQNYDSIILNELPKIAFDAKKSSRKIVFVLSDGVPAGDRGYGGPEAQRETRNAACRMRMMGIDVIAISLVPGVVKANDEIYGANFNIDASKDLRASFTKVITQLQKEGRF